MTGRITRSFTRAEDEEILRLYAEGLTQSKIAAALGRSRTSVRDRGVYLGLNWDTSDRLADRGSIVEDVNMALLRPIQLTIPARTTRPLVDNVPHATLVWGDVHFPFQDEQAVEVLYRFAEMVEIDGLVCLGDLVDNWQISSFVPPDEHALTPEQRDLAWQFQEAARHLGQMRSLCPKADDPQFLEGNHEERWTRLLRKAQTDYRWRHVLSLPSVRSALTMPKLLGISDAGYNYHHYAQSDLLLHDHIVITHGNRTTIWASRGMLEQYGKSVIFGHTHRIQNFTKTDLRATDSAWNIGCLCDLDPKYGDTTSVNWAQGFAVILWSDDYSHFSVVQLRIHGGICMTPWGEIRV